MKRTEIATLGEFGLIEHLANEILVQNSSSEKGIGDDAAVIKAAQQGQKTLITTDLLLEGVHFNLEYVPLKYLGYKAAVVNFSDIYAMNGTPQQIVVGIGISAKFSVEDVDELYKGIRLACKNYKVDIVGGDTTTSLTGLTIAITCVGVVDEKRLVCRNGAKINDLVCVTGHLGSAYLGLQVLERELAVFHTDRQSLKLDDYEAVVRKQLKPEARGDIVEQLQTHDIIPTSMIDISDGLSSELMHICKQSKVGCAIYEDKIPIDFQAVEVAEEMSLNIVTCALNGGEEYELLFTCDIHDYEKIVLLDDVFIIGHITDAEQGQVLIGRNGEYIPLQAQGWQAFKD